MPPPSMLRGVGGFVHAGFLEPVERRALAAWMASAPGDAAEVADAGPNAVAVDRGARRASELAAPAALATDLDARVAALAPALANHFGHPVGAAESVSLLRYGPGDRHRPHRDRGGRETAGRILSVVLFVNDRNSAPGFDGGALRFYDVLGAGLTDIGLDIDPEAGALVAFPSSWLHEVVPVTSGLRFTAVTWFVGPREQRDDTPVTNAGA